MIKTIQIPSSTEVGPGFTEFQFPQSGTKAELASKLSGILGKPVRSGDVPAALFELVTSKSATPIRLTTEEMAALPTPAEGFNLKMKVPATCHGPNQNMGPDTLLGAELLGVNAVVAEVCGQERQSPTAELKKAAVEPTTSSRKPSSVAHAVHSVRAPAVAPQRPLAPQPLMQPPVAPAPVVPPRVSPESNYEHTAVTVLKKIGLVLSGLILLPFVVLGLLQKGLASLVPSKAVGPDQHPAKITRGKQLLLEINAGRAQTPATKENVGDILFAIKQMAEANGEAPFTAGAYTLPDPGRRIAAFLQSCSGTYQRLSSHIKEHQNSPGGNHLGIDASSVFPGNKRTLLFGSLVTGEQDRLYVKMEQSGAALSFPKNGVDRNLPNRSPNFFDFMEVLVHAKDFIATRGHGSAAGSRKERIPSDVKVAWEALNGAFPANATLNQDNPLDMGINQMLSNVRVLQQTNPDNVHITTFLTFITQGKGYDDDAQNQHRIGNEVVFTPANFDPAR